MHLMNAHEANEIAFLHFTFNVSARLCRAHKTPEVPEWAERRTEESADAASAMERFLSGRPVANRMSVAD